MICIAQLEMVSHNAHLVCVRFFHLGWWFAFDAFFP